MYLISADAQRDGVKLRFFNPSTQGYEEVVDTRYRPYFFISHPMTPTDRATIDALGARIQVETKQDLFTGQRRMMTRVEVEDPAHLDRLSDRFERSWEGDVPYLLSYAYDRGLIFGAPHRIQRDHVEPIVTIPPAARPRFDATFREVRHLNPEKYAALERWFSLCSQPIPEGLSLGEPEDPERYNLAVLLARVANLPVPQAFANRQVSTWIKSLFHNYLRRHNILIPTSRELRRGETTRRVQGALTFPPEPGVYFNTVVTDFESLYPSLIDIYNLSHETIDCPHSDCRHHRVPGLEHHVCIQRRGVYSILIGALKDLRIHWYKSLIRDQTRPVEEQRLAQATAQLLKLILVSSYGVTIRIHGLARPSLAESITAYGRHSLQTTWDLALEGALHPIYGDTDSLFLDSPSEDQVAWLISTVKARLGLDLAVEERYAVCVLPQAMKAYFGIRRDGTADIRGVTAIKSSSPRFIRQVFRDCVEVMATVQTRDDYAAAVTRLQRIVQAAIRRLQAGEVPLRDLEYSMRLHDDPLDKLGDAALSQPYQCAIQLIDAGKPVQKRDVVTFVKVTPFTYRDRTFTVKPTEEVQNPREVNVADYVRNLRTALNQTFKSMNLHFQDAPETKVTLSDFM